MTPIQESKPVVEEIYFPFQNSSFPGNSDADVLKCPTVTVVQNPKNKPKYILTSKEAMAVKKDAEETKMKIEKKKRKSVGENSRVLQLGLLQLPLLVIMKLNPHKRNKKQRVRPVDQNRIVVMGNRKKTTRPKNRPTTPTTADSPLL